MTSVSHHSRARRQSTTLATVVLAGSLLAGCTPEGASTKATPTKRPSMAGCSPYGVTSAPVTLKLPGMVLRETRPLPARTGEGPRLAVMAVDEEGPDGKATTTASLFDGPASNAPDRIRSGIYVANIGDSRKWGVNSVAEGAISLSRTASTAQATDVSHSTFTAGLGNKPVTFDYWAFTASGHRYLLSYARDTPAKAPDAATFFATATSCAKSA